MGVAIPPVFAATGIHKINALIPTCSFEQGHIIGLTRASIITVVAVLDINIEKTAVINIRPSIMNLGWAPKGRSRTRAKFLSKSYFEAAMARVNPPIKRIIIGEEKVFKISLYGINSPRLCSGLVIRKIVILCLKALSVQEQ